MNTVFLVGTWSVMPFWVALIALPRWRVTRAVAARAYLPFLPAALYTLVIVPRLVTLLPVLAFPELGTIAALLGSPVGATVGWLHFLAFDLFVGRWVYLDGQARRMPHWVTAPILSFVLMFGPIGFLLHLAARRVWSSDDGAPASAR